MHVTTLARRNFLTGVVAWAGVPLIGSCFQRPSAVTNSEPYLAAATGTIEAAIEPSIVPLQDFFKKAQSGVPQFTDSARGWISTGKLAWDALPFTANNRHKDYLRNEFERHVFRAGELQSTIESCLNRFGKAIESAESEMLVGLNADSPNFPGRPKKQLDQVALSRECQAIISRSETATHEAVVEGVSRTIVAGITQRVLAQVAVSLARSLGVYWIGALAAPETLGASIVAAIVLDCLIGWIWDWYADPRGNLNREIKQQLVSIEAVLLDGINGQGGLKSEMLKYAKERQSVREEAVRNLLQESERLRPGG